MHETTRRQKSKGVNAPLHISAMQLNGLMTEEMDRSIGLALSSVLGHLARISQFVPSAAFVIARRKKRVRFKKCTPFGRPS